MTSPENETTPKREPWEEEIFYPHRWGRHGDKAAEEHSRLKPIWEEAQPMEQRVKDVIAKIIDLEICNWDLEGGILKLCRAIGSKDVTGVDVGHFASITDERWKEIWAYYVTLKNWLSHEISSNGYEALLKILDPDKKIRNHIYDMLGDRNELKELCVARLCLCLDWYLSGIYAPGTLQMKRHAASVSAIEEEIKARDPESMILQALESEGDGRLQPCSHKAFRRYDIIISSIGSGSWRAVIPRRGTDGFARAETLEKYLSPIEDWINTKGKGGRKKTNELTEKIYALLGKPDNEKIFLASFLVSILRGQQLSAIKRAESRVGK